MTNDKGKEIIEATTSRHQSNRSEVSGNSPPPKRPRTDPSGPDTIPDAKALVPYNADPPTRPAHRPPAARDPRPAPKVDHVESAPAELIESLKASRRLGHMLKLTQVFQSFTSVNIAHGYLCQSLAATFADAFESALLAKHHRRTYEVIQLKEEALRVLPDVIGRALYMRLYYLCKATGHNVAPFTTRPTFSNQTLLPAPIARAISCIGTFRPVGVATDIMYLPTYSQDPGHSGGTQAVSLLPRYLALEAEFRELQFHLAKTETKNREGTSWYLLAREEQVLGTRVFDIIARFPAQAGNITSTDAIMHSYTIRPNARDEYPLSLLDNRVGRDYGTILRDIRPHEPAVFMEADLGSPSEFYLMGVINT
uniref:Coat protein n=1 Tax=Racomitrium varium deltapartitivirus TaxID=2933094 RepID=A0A9C7LLX5_9VIRU|nr:putative coat protein [Racomitrium varium deltapartitivirus]CAI5383881.1 putative coat protein [Racomitrium varium deltapartitivirus]